MVTASLERHGPIRGRLARLGTLTVAALVLVSLPAGATGAIEPAPAHLPQTPVVDTTPQVVDLTFPVADPGNQVTFIDDFLYLRGGGSRLHAATDVMAPKHRPVHAAVGGTISFAPYPEPSYGWMISINGDDGRRYVYVHLNNDTPVRDANGRWLDDDKGGVEHAYAPRIVDAIRTNGHARGLRIERGELIGWNGDSGNAKGVAPHLHFEIHVTAEDGSTHRINPWHSLVKALERGDVPEAAPKHAGIYRDVDPRQAHGAEIEKLTEAGIITGCGDDRFCPGKAVSRGDLATYLVGALDLPFDPDARARFEDVGRDDPRSAAIAAVDTAGILTGYEDALFGPDRPLTRQQLASVLVRGLGVDAETASVQSAGFVDVRPGSAHALAIDTAAAVGLTRGCTVDRFCGGDDVRRDQIASFLDRGMAFRDR
jgi:murein DD-endopeptidase MepM/ murein hydrolase activator NlpD